MRLDQVIAKIRARLASLDTERAEAEAPLWAAALQDVYPQATECVGSAAWAVPTQTGSFDDMSMEAFSPVAWSVHRILWRGEQELTEGLFDKVDCLPDDGQLSLEDFNAKVDAVLADVAQWQQQVEETHGK